MSEKTAQTKMSPALQETYHKLYEAYVQRLKASLEAVDNIVSQRQLKPFSRDDLIRAQRLAHGLAGTGVTFGFPEVTKAGQKADSFIGKVIKALPAQKNLDDETGNEFQKLMQDLRKACEDGIKNQPSAPIFMGDAPTLPPKMQGAFEVLVIDDDEHVGSFLSLNLAQKGMRVTIARDGETAMSLLTKMQPDLIVLDISMPGLSGHEVLRRIKQDPEFLAIPVIMLTAQADQADVVGALHSGAIDYIVKPFHPEKLIMRIEKILDAGRHTVLIADNDPLVLQLLESKFRHAGFKSVLVEDGKKAWEQIIGKKPDLVILDMMMPGLSGMEILKKMKNEKASADIPVIVVSACKEKADIDSALQAGASKYIVKPFLSDELIGESLRLAQEKRIKR